MRHVLPVLAVAVGAAVVAGCSSSGQRTATPSTVVSTVFATPAPAQPTTPTPSPSPSTVPPPASTTTSVPAPPAAAPARPPAPASTMDAVAVVSAYYAAINAGDYRTAWNLGGNSLDSSYTAFVNGFAGTASDSVTITGSQGDTVSVRLDALQSDGSDQVYAGTYTVTGGHISSARLAAVGGAAPATSPPSAPILTPAGGYYSAGEFCPDRDAGLTTLDANGSTLTCVLESGRYHWHHY